MRYICERVIWGSKDLAIELGLLVCCDFEKVPPDQLCPSAKRDSQVHTAIGLALDLGFDCFGVTKVGVRIRVRVRVRRSLRVMVRVRVRVRVGSN